MQGEYVPTPAEDLKPDDTVRVPKGVFLIGVVAKKGCLVDLTSTDGAWIGTYLQSEMIDKWERNEHK